MGIEDIKQALPFLQAVVDGKQVERREKTGNNILSQWRPILDFDDDSNYFVFEPSIFEYRIKPSPKYRPFKDAEECWNEMLKHKPFGWVKYQGQYRMIVRLTDDGVIQLALMTNNPFSYEVAFKSFTFADGAIFGVMEE